MAILTEIQKNQAFKFFDKEKQNLEQYYPGIKKNRIISELENFVSAKDDKSLTNFYRQLEAGIPLEYISQCAYFYQSEFYVNQNVLIPRSETEILVEKALEKINAYHLSESIRVVDVGTGSGCIALTLAQLSKKSLNIKALDVSKAALNIARINHYRLGFTIAPKHRVQFEVSDRLETVHEAQDFIISNPPYIKIIESKSLVHEQVNRYEPHIALYLNDEEYENWFRDFFYQTSKLLKPKGWFLMEGHENYLKSQLETLKRHGFDSCQMVQDYTGRDRFLFAQKK